MESKRISSLDIFRGMIMVLMALDHTRDYFHIDAFQFLANDLSKTSGPIFLTRWVTHICAPAFTLLAGISAFLYSTKVNSKKDVSFYLITRGLLLIFLELTVIRYAWRFYIDYSSIGGLVIWALGWSMIFLAILIYLPRSILLIVSLSIIFFHNLLDGMEIPQNKVLDLLLAFFHQSRSVTISNDFAIFILYPVLPMIGLMAFGYCIGQWFKEGFDREKRIRNLFIIGTGITILFILLRYINQYGDPNPWSYQKNDLFTILSFLNVAKYPMSLDYILMTIGPSFLFLALIERLHTILFKPFNVIGRVSLMYYLVHLFLIHFLALVLAILVHPSEIAQIVSSKWGKLADYGYSLPIVYLIWIGIVTILYFFCIRYDAFKRKTKSKWLRYF